mgnify:CR=1 FL=1
MGDDKAKDPLADVPAKWREQAREHDAKIDQENEHIKKSGKDAVEQASIDSFPASDPPSKTVTRGEKTE